MKYILYWILLLCVETAVAQLPVDTAFGQKPSNKPAVKKAKPVLQKKDAVVLKKVAAPDTLTKNTDTGLAHLQLPFKAGGGYPGYRGIIGFNPYFNFFGTPENRLSEERPARGKDALFYLLAGLLFFFALVKLFFSRYVSNLVGLVFRGSLRQKQIREQLLQTPLPSLLLNIFFVMVAGLYILFLLKNYNMALHTPFWLLLLYCVVAVGLVYLVKFMILKLTGWIFNMRDAADTYIFIVFLVNKLLAIFLLPLLIIMAFSLANWSAVLLTLSYIMVGMFFAYRYIVSFAPVRREVKVSQFHFFMYLCAFEIVPLLLIYKVLVHFF